jgi:hypothetical protein
MNHTFGRRRFPLGRPELRLIEELRAMNCELVQRRLLAAESPEQPPADVRRHLAACPACRAWQRRLAQAEQQLPHLATPPSERRDRVVRLILNAPNPAAHARTGAGYGRGAWSNTTARERGLRKAALAIAMAAALGVFALAWWLLGQPTTAPQPRVHPDVAGYLSEREEVIVKSPTKRARVEGFAGLAERVQQDALGTQNDPEKVRRLATLYTALVHEDLLPNAKRLAPELPREVLVVLAEQLRHQESNLSRMAGNHDLKPETQASLREMATAARTGRDQVLEILDRKTA